MNSMDPKAILVLGFFVLLPFLMKAQTNLQHGDIVFIPSTGSELSKAIDDVTTDQRLHYTHMGIIFFEGADTTVLHADTDCGVCEDSWRSFSQDYSVVDVYRLRDVNLSIVDSALITARSFIGEPYNFTYILEDSGLYCSELIYESFKPWRVFELNPMTFKNRETNEFNETWVSYYSKLGVPIPEGMLGCNPNDMAKSPRLKLIEKIR